MFVQVCLGVVETWILEPKESISHLEGIFDVKIEIPNQSEILTKVCECPSGTHPGSLVCTRCKYAFGRHENTECPDSWCQS